jgi:methylated-DNA-[protein]-cysteine S-methyltransferase
MTHFYKKIKTPVGELTLVATDASLTAILWENDSVERVRLPKIEASTNHPILRAAETQLQEYFGGHRIHFQLPVEFHGSEFQVKVWRTLQTIPYGETRSYGALANSIGSPKSCRAVGGANGRNPISIVVPCHRVIGVNGKLTGFAGGVKTKSYLLDLEKNYRS